MTVTVEDPRKEFAGNGVTVAFTTAKVYDETHVVAYLVEDADPTNVTTWALTTDFTMSNIGAANATLTAVVAPANGYTLVTDRVVPNAQDHDYTTNDDFPAESHERALDLLTMQVQQLDSRLDRAFRLSSADISGLSLELSNPTALYAIRVNTAGTALEFFEIGSTTLAIPADGSVTLAKHSALMPRYSIMARATAGTGKPEYYALDSEKFAELANSVADGYVMTVGTGGGYANLNAAIEAFVRRGYYPGATLYLEVLSDLTETRPVRFPVGAKVVVYSSVSRTIDLAAGSDSVDNQYQGALIIPDGAWCHFVSTSDTFTLDYSDPSGAVAAPKAAVVVHGTLTTDSSILSIAATAASLKPDHLIYSVGGRIQTTAAIILSDDATTGYALDAYGGYIGALFAESAAANTDVIRVNYATVDLRATSGTPHYEVNGCCGKVVAGISASGPVLTAKYSHIDLNPYSSFTTTATADCTAHLINVDGGRLNISGDFDIASAGAGCTRVVNAYNGAEVVATGCTFTGQGGDYALYGATGSTLKGSGNTYTTLTGSNLTGTWAAGGQYLNA